MRRRIHVREREFVPDVDAEVGINPII